MADILDYSALAAPSTGDAMYVVDDAAGTPVDKYMLVDNLLTKFNLLGGLERSSDPAEPAEGYFVMWMSDGSEKGDDGDVLIASNPDGTCKYSIVFDYSAGTAFSS